MGAPIMSKFLSILGIADEKQAVEDINENEESFEFENTTFTDVETPVNDFTEDVSGEEEKIVDEENNGVFESKLFNFYKPKKAEKEVKEYIPSISRRTQTKVLPMTSTATSKMIISYPQSFDAIKDIADNVKEKRSVIVNLESVSYEDGRRIIDFLSGTAHALDGTIQKVSKLIFLVAPKDIEVEDESDKYNYSSKLNMTWLKK